MLVYAVVLVDDVLDKIFAFFDVFCFLSVLSIHLLVVLSKLVCIFSLLLLGQNLLASISGYFILDAIAFVHLAFYVVLLVIQKLQTVFDPLALLFILLFEGHFLSRHKVGSFFTHFLLFSVEGISHLEKFFIFALNHFLYIFKQFGLRAGHEGKQHEREVMLSNIAKISNNIDDKLMLVLKSKGVYCIGYE